MHENIIKLHMQTAVTNIFSNSVRIGKTLQAWWVIFLQWKNELNKWHHVTVGLSQSNIWTQIESGHDLYWKPWKKNRVNLLQTSLTVWCLFHCKWLIFSGECEAFFQYRLTTKLTQASEVINGNTTGIYGMKKVNLLKFTK